jgi:hypothetical protein
MNQNNPNASERSKNLKIGRHKHVAQTLRAAGFTDERALNIQSGREAHVPPNMSKVNPPTANPFRDKRA